MRILSGIQPTGTVHLGNYYGALINWVKLQNEGHDCFFMIVNQHAITLPQDPAKLARWTLEIGATLLAVGLDPDKSALFVQSDVPQHSQLAWVLNCLAPMGVMERMIQFKEKSESNPDAVNLGLFTYPVLQSADILLYKADMVPVGKDQDQHLELTRELARKFNNAYADLFKEPQTLHTEVAKVVGLDGGAKMSKSKNNYIGLTESADDVWNKLRGAATDPARVKRTDAGNPEICNIYALHKLMSPKEDQDWVQQGCRTAQIGCMDCKKKLFTNMDATLAPIRERFNELMANPEPVYAALQKGAIKARAVAQQTLDEVYAAIGFKY